MDSGTHVFQISGIKIRDKKRILVKGIRRLGGKYIGGSIYQRASTHLITPRVLYSEKFLASCASGKWVVTPEYVLDSVKNGSWLPEGPYEVAINTGAKLLYCPVRAWREKVAGGRVAGAFQSWRVLLMAKDPARRALFQRVLKAGGAQVYHYPPPTTASITHVMVEPLTENSLSHSAPRYPVSHIAQYLFGSNSANMKVKISDEDEIMDTSHVDFLELETELKEYAIEQEGRPRLRFPEFLGYHESYRACPQAPDTDLCNVRSMMECGFFSEAVEEISSSLFPGWLPPAPHLASLIEYAQQGNATDYFLRNFEQLLHCLLMANPPWLPPSTTRKFFTQVLQCPRCKEGLWPFLETAIGYCLSREEVTCHPLPGPALPTLLRFHYHLLAFVLKLFKGELQSVTPGDFLLLQGSRVSQVSSQGSLLYRTFWTVWERSILLSRAVKQLIKLTVQAATEEYAEGGKKQKMHLADTLLDLLSVLVEFWCQQHFKLNQTLVENGVKDLAEHFAITSQGASAVVLAELMVRVSSSRLRLALADAAFRSLCCRSGFTMGDQPLSLKKVLSYLPALGRLAQSPSGALCGTPPPTHSCGGPGTSCGIQNAAESEASQGKESIPRGLRRVNAAGETLLHRACKRNQVETVLQILALPGTDVNVKDHAGWTPLHEACNHGSTECVEALLRHCPAPVVDGLVGGVSPLHDALLNGHLDIAKKLLEYAGSRLLQQPDGRGRTARDLTSSANWEELLRSARVGDGKLTPDAAEVSNPALLEAGSALLAHMVVSYKQERRLPSPSHPNQRVRGLARRLLAALRTRPAGWTERRAAALAEDAETLLEVGRGGHLGLLSPAVRESKGEATEVLMEMLQILKSQGETLAADLPQAQ